MDYYIVKYMRAFGELQVAHTVEEDGSENIIIAEFSPHALRGAGYIDSSRIKVIGVLDTYSNDHWVQQTYNMRRAGMDGKAWHKSVCDDRICHTPEQW